jgi:hypothetical protein
MSWWRTVLALGGFLVVIVFIVFGFWKGDKVKPNKDAQDQPWNHASGGGLP